METGAQFSESRVFRYALWRTWEEQKGHVMFIGLNPSTADEQHDDATVRRCIAFAREWGYGGLHMLNLFAYRSTDPKVLMDPNLGYDPVGPKNDEFLRLYTESSDQVIAAWGANGAFQTRGEYVDGLLDYPMACLGVTKSGQPRHPLYLRKTLRPHDWTPPWRHL